MPSQAHVSHHDAVSSANKETVRHSTVTASLTVRATRASCNALRRLHTVSLASLRKSNMADKTVGPFYRHEELPRLKPNNGIRVDRCTSTSHEVAPFGGGRQLSQWKNPSPCRSSYRQTKADDPFQARPGTLQLHEVFLSSGTSGELSPRGVQEKSLNDYMLATQLWI